MFNLTVYSHYFVYAIKLSFLLVTLYIHQEEIFAAICCLGVVFGIIKQGDK